MQCRKDHDENGAYGSLLRSVSRPNVKWVCMTTRCWGQYLDKRWRTKKCLEEITQGRAAQISYQILLRVWALKVQEHQSYNTHARARSHALTHKRNVTTCHLKCLSGGEHFKTSNYLYVRRYKMDFKIGFTWSFCTGVKLGLPHWGKRIGWGYSRGAR